MKKLLIFLVLGLLYSTGNCQEYETIVDATKQWSVVTKTFNYINEPPYTEKLTAWTTSYRFRGDTLINDYLYKFLEECKDSLFQEWYRSKFLLRDDSSDRVFIHNYTNEKLLYDYNVKAGDTIWIPFENYIEIVDSAKYEIIASKERKTIFGKYFSTYIKGFGTYEGPLGFLYHNMVGDFTNTLSCFKQNDTLLYSYGESCYVEYNYTDVKEINFKQSILLFPNPAKNLLSIELSNFNKGILKIFSSDGRIILEKQINNTGKQSINIESFHRGIYFVVFINQVNEIYKGKFIKM